MGWRRWWRGLNAWLETLGLFVVVAGVFLHLQYDNVSSLCLPGDHFAPCPKFAIRSDLGMGLIVVGVFAVALGFMARWRPHRR